MRLNFNPPAPCGTGPHPYCNQPSLLKFQSTRPLRDGTEAGQARRECCRISIHPPLAGRDPSVLQPSVIIKISIHPPLAGRDLTITTTLRNTDIISIHPPLAGRDTATSIYNAALEKFQSTRPLRDGTWLITAHIWRELNFNPPAPCGTGR